MKTTKRNKFNHYITKEQSLVLSFLFHGKKYELPVSFDKCIKSTDDKTFWISYTYSGISSPNVDFNTSMVTFFITMDSVDNKPSTRNLQIIAYWEDTYDVGEFVECTIKCFYSHNPEDSWLIPNTYRGDVYRLGIDIPWHMLSSFIH